MDPPPQPLSGSVQAHERKLRVQHMLRTLINEPDRSNPSSYLVKEDTRQQIRLAIFGHLLETLPSTSVLVPHSDQLDDIRQVLAIFIQNDYALASTQSEQIRQAAKAKQKGKQAQRGASPFGFIDGSADTLDDHALLGPEYAPERRGMPCGHLFKKGEAIYRCRDCGLDDTCVQCAPCFQASVHVAEGHDIVFSVSQASGGCCDCGDPEAWTRDVGCRYHSHSHASDADADNASPAMDVEGSVSPSNAPANGTNDPSLSAQEEIARDVAALPDNIRQPLVDTIQSCLEFILTVLEYSPDDMSLPVGPDVIDVLTHQPSLEPEARVGSAQAPDDSHLDSVDSSDSEQDEDMAIVEDSLKVIDYEDPLEMRDPSRSGEQLPSGSRSASSTFLTSGSGHIKGKARRRASSDTSRGEGGPSGSNTRPRLGDSQATKAASDDKRQFAVVLWNDEKHSFSQVIDTVTDATGMSELGAKGVAEKVDKHGREVIEISTAMRRLISVGRMLGAIDLAVSIRPAYDIFAEEVAHVLLSFLIDLSSCNLYLPDAQGGPDVPNAAILKQLIAQVMFEQWIPMEPISPGSMRREFFDPSNLSRYAGLLLMESKMCKSARIGVRNLLISLIARREVKGEISRRFAKVYPKLVETFILRDREPDHSICYLTVQLFSVPSIASMLVQTTGFLQQLLVILQAIFTGQMSGSNQHLILPPPPPTRGQVNPHLMLLRQSRCYHIFFDIRYLLASEGVQKQIARDPEVHLKYILHTLSLFHAINPSKRAVSAHVEFESEMWIPVFHVSSHLAKCTKRVGEAFSHAQPAQLKQALSSTAKSILMSCYTLHQNNPENHPPIKFHSIQFGPQPAGTHQVVEFAVDRQPVSFHHPMHWLLSEMIKQISAIDRAALEREFGTSRLIELFQPEVDETGLLIVFEFPLRVCVKLAQIRCNMWVRNGFAIRSQAHHYRDNSMRGLMYDQDLAMVQAGLAAINPERFLATVLSRFDLLEWFDGSNVQFHSVYDTTQAVFMAEELLLLLLTCFAELADIGAWNMERVIRREIIQFLALNQGTYSDLTKHISEKLCDHSAFERVLGQVSNFRAPDGTNDLGIFELKDECYDEVQPFFYHYSRNQRERAEEVLKARQKKKMSQSSAKPVKGEDLVPVLPFRQLDSLPPHIFDGLRKALMSENLARILFFSINNTRLYFPYAPDLLVDAAIQIIMVGLVEEGDPFATRMATDHIAQIDSEPDSSVEIRTVSGMGTLLDLLCLVEMTDKFKPFRSKIGWCLFKAAELSRMAKAIVDAHHAATGRGQSASKSGASGAGSNVSAEEAKRAVAKARQAAIMQKFSAQQKSLLDQFEAEEGDDDDDEDEDFVDAENAEGGGTDFVESRNQRKSWGSCILCQENLGMDKVFGLLGHVQPSRMMRTTPKQDAASLQQAFETPLTLDRNGSDGKRVVGTAIGTRIGAERAGGSGSGSGSATAHRGSAPYGCFPQQDHRFGFNASTCGHLMHVSCFETYLRSVEQRHAQQIARNHPEDLAKCEFVCPLCKSLGNVILPIADAGPTPEGASDAFPSFSATVADETPLQDWIRKINIDILKHSSKTQAAEYQETDHGSGAFLPFFVEHVAGHVRAEHARNTDFWTNHMINRLVDVLKPLSHSSKGLREKYQQRTILAPQSRKMYIPEELVAYTIAMTEVAQRGMAPATSASNGLNVADALSESQLSLIQSLIHSLRHFTVMHPAGADGPGVVRRGLLKRLLPHWGGDDSVRSPLLLRDPLTILVEAAIVAPESLEQCTALMYYVCLVQTVFGLAQPSIWPQAYGLGGAGAGFGNGGGRAFVGLKSCNVSAGDIAEARKIFPDIRWTVANIIGFVGYARGNITLGFDNLDDDTLAKMICSYTLPFLRRAAILQKVVNLQVSPARAAAARVSNDADGTAPGEYRRLLVALGIPPPSVAMPIRAEKQTPIGGLVEGWIKHAYAPLASLFRPLPIQPAPLGASFFGSGSTGEDGSSRHGGLQPLSSSHIHAAESHPTLLLEHPHIYELAKLPLDLAVLLQETQRRVCKNCKSTPPEPALCLFCGDILCYQSFCCQQEDNEERGECNHHTDVCGGSVGVYFKVKSNVIMLLYHGNGTYNYSPYLDSHGEIDIGLRKGRPQRLHQQRYDELRKQVLNHGVANIVARKIEAAMDAGGWQTF